MKHLNNSYEKKGTGTFFMTYYPLLVNFRRFNLRIKLQRGITPRPPLADTPLQREIKNTSSVDTNTLSNKGEFIFCYSYLRAGI